jgi:hypothetical protein
MKAPTSHFNRCTMYILGGRLVVNAAMVRPHAEMMYIIYECKSVPDDIPNGQNIRIVPVG